MPRHRHTVCITGAGIATSLGAGKQENWTRAAQSRSGIRAISRFETKGLRTTIGGTIGFGELDQLPFVVRTERLAHLVVEEALAQAALSSESLSAQLFLGVPPAEMSWAARLPLAVEASGGKPITYAELVPACSRGDHRSFHERFLPGGTASRLAERFGTRGAPVVVNTACATGATIIQLAAEAIRRGDCDMALAVASDASIVPDTIVRFSLLAALSVTNDPPEEAARPFSLDRDGFVLGEGAAALVLENCETAKARGQPILGFIAGLGESADRFHLVRSSPDASAIVAAMRGAIADSGFDAGDIDYVNAHGTGTPENDRVEGLAHAVVFGADAERTPISSNKSMIGHTMSAAGAVEAVLSLLSIEHQTLLPTINYRIPDPSLKLDVVANAARPAAIRNVLSNSFGFGGQNVCLLFSAEPAGVAL